MSVENDIKALRAQRDAIKGQLNLFDTFLSNYNKETDVIQLQIRLQRLTATFEKFDAISDTLDAYDESDASRNERFIVLNSYFEATSKAQALIAGALFAHFTITNQNVAPAEGSGTPSVTHTNDELRSASSTLKRKLKLPTATIDPFDGQIEKWLSFENSFTEYYDKRDDLSDLGKFQCLESALRGEALDKIKIFPVAEENYQKAWNHLKKVYGNWRLQISRHLTIILNLPMQDPKNPKSLEMLADKAILNLESLKSLGVDISQEIVVQILQERLLADTKLDWNKTLKRNEFPTLDLLTEFKYQRAALQSLTSYEAPSQSKGDNGPPAKMRKTDNRNSTRSFTTSNRKCIACSEEQHALYQCKKFKEMSVNERVKLIREAKLCANCLRGHGKSECRFGNCKTCGKKHNTLLHYPKRNESKSEDNSEKSA